MATFLQLCQAVARESGTVSGLQPVSVSGQEGRVAKIVGWTAEAWRLIQSSRSDWLFRRRAFTAPLLQGIGDYTPTGLGLGFFSRWLLEPDLLTIYRTALGVADETVLRPLDWGDFRRMFRRGAQTPGRPHCYSTTPQGNLVVGPLPDAPYTLNGEHLRLVQVLAANDDTPILHSDHHNIIVWRALMLLADHDEAAFQRQQAEQKYRQSYADLCQAYTQQMRVGGPLA